MNEIMTRADGLVQQLRAENYFVFAYKLSPEELHLPHSQQQSILKKHFDKLLTAFYERRPKVYNYRNEVERY